MYLNSQVWSPDGIWFDQRFLSYHFVDEIKLVYILPIDASKFLLLYWIHKHGYKFWNFSTFQKTFQFTTSEAVVNNQYKNYCVRVVSQVTKHLMTYGLRNLINIRKVSKLGGNRNQCPILHPEIKLQLQRLKITQIQISQFFIPGQFCLI